MDPKKLSRRISYTTGWILALGFIYERGNIHLVLPFLVIEIDLSTRKHF